MEKKYVYLICDPSNDAFKIGVTKNLTEKRLKQLQTGNGTELFLSNYHLTDYPYRIESMLHHHFSPKRMINEWFSLDANDVANFKILCNEYEKTIELLKDNPFFAKGLH